MALQKVLLDVGLLKCPKFYLDVRFIAAILSGVVALWFIYDWVPVFSSSIQFHWGLFISVLIWQPFIEELLFRGIIQGQLSKYKWGQKNLLRITSANVVVSVLFVGLHTLTNPPLWAISIVVPSIVFGYFRDTFKSVYPSIILHSAYNAIALAGLFIHGNLII
ncbi:MAG: JDVT-CTERM system glutamic-type intramembrane protease [Gammaproteobacteria bacterium]|nr:JDVT-CTERM system glutamic-type intramembrane protease [Gammaproteobacteria bacterium]MCW8923120.1 JDVT-CTERM system glutamic-type intramembrane protease [Gammaproteobacteria bacterium]